MIGNAGEHITQVSYGIEATQRGRFGFLFSNSPHSHALDMIFELGDAKRIDAVLVHSMK